MVTAAFSISAHAATMLGTPAHAAVTPPGHVLRLFCVSFKVADANANCNFQTCLDPIFLASSFIVAGYLPKENKQKAKFCLAFNFSKTICCFINCHIFRTTTTRIYFTVLSSKS